MADADAHDLLMELMLLVDSEIPILRDVTRKLNEFASSVAESGPDMREHVLGLGAYAIVCRAWIFCCYSGVPSGTSQGAGSKQCRDAVLRALHALTAGFPDTIDDVGWQIIAQTMEKSSGEHSHILLFKLIRNIAIKSEENRDHFTWNLQLLETMLALGNKNRLSGPYLREWCSALKALILSDDVRAAYNRAPERKRIILRAQVLPTIAARLQYHEFENDEGTLNAIVVLLASMAINDETRSRIESGNVLAGIRSIFKNHFHNKTLMRNTLSLLKSLCACQSVREKASSHALMKWPVDLLVNYKLDADIVDIALSCCAYMTLNNPCQIAQFIAKGGINTSLQIMTDYNNNIGVLKEACLTLRNVAETGGPESRDKMKEAGCVAFLNLLALNVLDIKEFYILPILRELGTNQQLAGDTMQTSHVQELVRLEPQEGRKSVFLDENETEEETN